MTSHSPERDAPPPVPLDVLGPRRGWVDQLPGLGREAARRRAARGDWADGVVASGRWALPLAAAAAVACWLGAAGRLEARPLDPDRRVVLLAGSSQALLLAGSSHTLLLAAPLEGRR